MNFPVHSHGNNPDLVEWVETVIIIFDKRQFEEKTFFFIYVDSFKFPCLPIR